MTTYLKKWLLNDDVEAVLIPAPDEPVEYDLHIYARSTIAAQDAENRTNIFADIDSSELRDIVIWTDDSSKTLSWSDAKGILEKEGFNWLSNIPKLSELSPLIHFNRIAKFRNKPKAIVPFIPEFAHDINKAKYLIENQIYNIKPISAEFVPTLNCMCRCTQCSYKIAKIASGLWMQNDMSTDSKYHMTPEAARTLINKLVKIGIKYLVVTGGGEPLLNWDATSIALDVANENNISTGIFTNGILLSKYASRIMQKNLTFIRISVDAGSSSIYNAYRKPIDLHLHNFNRVEDGIAAAAKIRRDNSLSTMIGLSYIVNPINSDDIKEFANLVRKIAFKYRYLDNNDSLPGIDFVRFTPTVEYFSAVQHDKQFYGDVMAELLEDVKPSLEKSGIQTTIFSKFSEIENYDYNKGYDECLGAPFFVEVSPSGKLYHCCEMDFLPGYEIGDLLEKEFDQIWEDKMRKTVIQTIKASGMRGCPIFCKPHSINKIAHKIKNKSDNRRGIDLWMRTLNEIHNDWDGDEFFIKQKPVAF